MRENYANASAREQILSVLWNTEFKRHQSRNETVTYQFVLVNKVKMHVTQFRRFRNHKTMTKRKSVWDQQVNFNLNIIS